MLKEENGKFSSIWFKWSIQIYIHVKVNHWSPSYDSGKRRAKLHFVRIYMWKCFRCDFISNHHCELTLSISNDNAKIYMYVLSVYRHEFKCFHHLLYTHVHIMCHNVAIALIKKIQIKYTDIFKLQLFVHVYSDGGHCVNRKDPEQSKNNHVYNETPQHWMAYLLCTLYMQVCVCVYACIFGNRMGTKKQTLERMHSMQSENSVWYRLRANKPINWVTECLCECVLWWLYCLNAIHGLFISDPRIKCRILSKRMKAMEKVDGRRRK